jgi:cytochrome P450
MGETVAPADVAKLAAVPMNPLPRRQQLEALKAFHVGQEVLRDAGGPVTRLKVGPGWLMPELVVATSLQGARDILGLTGKCTDKTAIHFEMQRLIGPNLFVLRHQPWLPRRRALQPVFTKKNIRAFGEHMARAADEVGANWSDGARIDLDAECRRLTLRALGRSVLGIDLSERADAIADPLNAALGYITYRATRPVKPPHWLPTPARGRARAAATTMRRLAEDILGACRADPTRDAPLVRALMTATDPETGRALSDAEIRDELVVFMIAGHDTTATTLTYALWALGHHADIQERVRAEVAAIGERELTPDDIPRLGYTVQVLHEALRLCPPAPRPARQAVRDMEVDGYRVPAGTAMFVGTYALHRDPALWDRPLVFDPDRFSPENAKRLDRWQYLPFGGGPRTCIGDHFAMLLATLALATIVGRNEIRSLDDDFPLALPFTLVAAAPIHAQVNFRSRRTYI